MTSLYDQIVGHGKVARPQRLIAELPERSQAVFLFCGGKFNGKPGVMDPVGSMYGIFAYI